MKYLGYRELCTSAVRNKNEEIAKMTALKELQQQKKTLLLKERPPRAREAAKLLGISEAEYVALSYGETCTMLDNNRFTEILLQLETVGEVMALTRNDAMVLEHHGTYQGGTKGKNHVIFNTPEIDLRLNVSKWKYGFAVDENKRQSLQFFDEFGEAAHKIYVTSASDKSSYEAILHEFSTTGSFSDLKITNKPEAHITHIKDVNIDQEAIHKDWKALDDVHQINGFLEEYSVTRPQAYRYLGNDAITLQRTALEGLLEKVSELQIPLLIFVSNSTSTQIHNGVVNKLMEMGPWFNVLDPKFSLHANMELVSETWMVTKYLNGESPTYSMELFDINHNSLMMVYLHPEARKNDDKKQLWADILMSLQEK